MIFGEDLRRINNQPNQARANQITSPISMLVAMLSALVVDILTQRAVLNALNW
ncbi:hypothetical protein [Moraxella cuniculi]|uniref:hypothetical protein n=1 Tax=Moraxella cuniculi TaxID=34061 RepID=UPI001301867A|nr:hypothetical protein [Moraxella cuniculi]